jgi:hypothetical protein
MAGGEQAGNDGDGLCNRERNALTSPFVKPDKRHVKELEVVDQDSWSREKVENKMSLVNWIGC